MLLYDLLDLGLSEEESKVYITLLELGGGFASAVARKADIPRAGCYYTLENLVKKGFVSFYPKKGVKFFQATDPEKFAEVYEEKFHKAQKVLPQLLSITNKLAIKPKIHFFEGIAGIKNILKMSLEAKDEIIGFSNIEAREFLLGSSLEQYCHNLQEKKIKTRLISPLSEKGKIAMERYYKGHEKELEILFVNPKEFLFENEVTIFNNTVSIISLNPEELMGVVLESATLARTERSIFNLAWLGATSFIAK